MGLAFIPVSMLPQEPRQHFKIASREFSHGLAKLAQKFADSLDEKELQRFCLERLPRYMVPEVWELRDELPKTSTGKIARSVLQEV